MKFTFFNKYQSTTQRPASRALTTGFTLIETLIYIGLYAIIIGGAIVAVYAIVESAGRNQTQAMLEEEGIFIAGKIDWALSGAKIIYYPALLETGSEFSVTKYNGTLIVVATSSLGTMTMQDGGPEQPLNNTNTEVSRLLFTHIGVRNDGVWVEGIQASFRLSARAPNGMMMTRDFSATKYLRK